MKAIDKFTLYELMGEWVLVPLQEGIVEFNSIITINESGVLLWNKLKEGATEEELNNILIDTYELEPEVAKLDVQDFISTLKKENLLESE